MARCMLCSSVVGDGDVVCPHCGGAVTEDAGSHDAGVPGAGSHGAGGDDPTRVTGPGADLAPWDDVTRVQPDPGADQWVAPPAPGYGAPGYGAPPAGYEVYGPEAYAASTYGPQPYGAPSEFAGGYGPPVYAGGYGYGAPAYGAPVFQPRPPTDGMALGAFLTSLLSLVLTFACGVTIIGCPVGAVLGHVALRRIARNGAEGRGLALAGVIIGWIGTALLVLGIAIFVAVVAASA